VKKDFAEDENELLDIVDFLEARDLEYRNAILNAVGA
jgi:hypothetical protein